jgi:hypothetical protein
MEAMAKVVGGPFLSRYCECEIRHNGPKRNVEASCVKVCTPKAAYT